MAQGRGLGFVTRSFRSQPADGEAGIEGRFGQVCEVVEAAMAIKSADQQKNSVNSKPKWARFSFRRSARLVLGTIELIELHFCETAHQRRANGLRPPINVPELRRDPEAVSTDGAGRLLQPASI